MVDLDRTSPRSSLARRLSTRLRLRTVPTSDLLGGAALAGLAVAQPLLDLFGRNPGFFVAQDASTADIVAFALVVTFAVPVVCLVVELAAVADPVGRVAAVLGGFGANGPPEDRQSALIAGEGLVERVNEVSLLVPVDDGRGFEQAQGPS